MSIKYWIMFIVFFILSVIYGATTTNIFRKDKDLRDKYLTEYRFTIFMQIILVILCILSFIGGYVLMKNEKKQKLAIDGLLEYLFSSSNEYTVLRTGGPNVNIPKPFRPI